MNQYFVRLLSESSGIFRRGVHFHFSDQLGSNRLDPIVQVRLERVQLHAVKLVVNVQLHLADCFLPGRLLRSRVKGQGSVPGITNQIGILTGALIPAKTG